MPEVYDNWERLVEAILKRDELRRLALCPSFSSCTSDDSSSPSLIDFYFLDLNSDNSLEPLPGVGKRGVAARAARLFTAPPILRALFLRTKPEVQHPVFHIPNKLRRFSFRELIIATDNFNKINFLGRGRYSKVYKGRLEDGTLVAVKRCMPESTQYEYQQFQIEIDISIAMHRNLLHLHGFCATTEERILVYPLMVNGTVASWLRETKLAAQPPLDWSTRKRIALGSARGLEFLHQCDPIVIHLDVKAANILLDEDFEAVLCGFGLAILMDRNDTHVITTPLFGTYGHIPPECLSTGQVSEKTDVFVYGIMLLELLSGQRVFDLGRLANDDDVMLLDWVWKLVKENKLETLIDSKLEGNYIKAEGEQLVQLALICTHQSPEKCTHQSPEKRPEMRVVVKMLESKEGLAERWEEFRNDGMFRHLPDYEPIN